MTPNTSTTNGQSTAIERAKPPRKPAKRKAAARRGAKRSSGNRRSAESGYSATASRLMSRGMQVAGDAYGWAAEGAGRALPLAASRMPDQRSMQRMIDERPYVLGAIGLGIGAMIGMMLPSRMMSIPGITQKRPAGRRSRKR